MDPDIKHTHRQPRRWRRGIVGLALVLAWLAPAARSAGAQEDLELLEERAFRAAVDRVAPSVVRIQTLGGAEGIGRTGLGSGPATGLVIDAGGYILSSTYSFLSWPASILVELPDGSRKPARLVATDHTRMIVLLKIEVDGPLAVPAVVPESEMQVGQWAIAVGRTFEADRPNVSVGIVSALNRVWGKAIQTDAAVSPNNYGGPLVDLRGRVLGVLVPLSPDAATEMAGVRWYDSGIGFAVPARHLQRVLPKLMAGEDLHPGVIGISFAPGNPSTTEPVIAACHPNSPAYGAGLRAGDRIVEIEGRQVVRASQAREQLARRYAGETVRLAVLRGGQRIERELEMVAKLEPYEHPFLGILPMRDAAIVAGRSRGVTVRYVYPDGPAAQAGMERGDRLVSMQGEAIQDADQLRRRISDLKPGDEVELEIRRGQETLARSVRLGRLPEDLPATPLPPARHITNGEGPAPVRKIEQEAPQVGPIQWKLPEFENDARAYVPEGYDRGARYGIVVWLHAPGRFDWDRLAAHWKPHCDRGDLILLAPKAAHADAWTLRELTLVRKLIDELNSTYTIDPTRIVVHGQGDGGRLAYLVAFQNRDLVRAVAAVDAPMLVRPPPGDPVYRLAFYVAWAKGCREADRIQASVAGLRDLSYPVTVKDLGDEPRDLDAEEVLELARWIDTLDRI